MHADSPNPEPAVQSTVMAEGNSKPKRTAWEYFLWTVVVVLGIVFGTILAVIIAFSTGMIGIDC